MTAFSKEQIPDSITTHEELSVWNSHVLNVVNPNKTVDEGGDEPVIIAQFGLYRIDKTRKTNVFTRLSLELEDDYISHAGPVWEKVKEISTTPVPSHLTAQG